MDDKPFSCDLCDYKGKTPADLKGHIRVHYAEEELKCSESGCDFTCRAQATLKSHYLKKHTGEEIQYECHLCHKRYNRENTLTKHLISVHNFSWPSGHSRFRYNRDEASGVHRLQTIRFESADLQEELQGGSSLRIADQEEARTADRFRILPMPARFARTNTADDPTNLEAKSPLVVPGHLVKAHHARQQRRAGAGSTRAHHWPPLGSRSLA